jgi:hypothetical protein
VTGSVRVGSTTYRPTATVTLPAAPSFAYNVFSSAHTSYLTSIANLILPTDRFVVISGNNASTLNVNWMNTQATALRKLFQGPIYGYTAGCSAPDNVSPAASGLNAAASAVIYGYEPNMTNEPEFAWPFSTTLANARTAAAKARAGNQLAGIAPSSRPLLQSSLSQYNWDYGQIMSTVDFMLVQTQTYAANGTYPQAITKLKAQISSGDWCPQLTIDSTETNGVSVDVAVAAYNAAPTPLLSLWVAAAESANIGAFIQAVR